VIETLINIFRVPELKKRVLFTLGVLAVYCVCSLITLPGIDQGRLQILQQDTSSGIGQFFGIASMLSAGQFSQCTIIALGIMPYISASIIFQLLSSTVPALERLAKEGESGRRKINEYTRYATVPLCLVQAAMYIRFMTGQQIMPNTTGAWVEGLIVFTTGTIFLMWLGEQIDEYGIGNGASILITAGIVDRVPAGIQFLAESFDPRLTAGGGKIGIGTLVVLAVGFVAVILGVVLIYQGQRRIPIQQAKHMRGRRVYGGQRQYLPLRVNQASVMPVIFASSLLIFPSWTFRYLGDTFSSSGPLGVFKRMFESGAFVYNLLYVAMIFFFAFFWTAIQFNPKEMANNLRDYGSFIPGMRPGRRTADYLERVMIRITLAGAAFLALIAVLPQVVMVNFHVPWVVASFFGGTGLLIVVSVLLDVVQKVESHLLMRHYEGFMRSGRR
jgi:preprotein translocase subunit SecY